MEMCYVVKQIIFVIAILIVQFSKYYRLEDCVKGIMDMSNDLAPGDEKRSHPADAAEQIAEYHLLDKETCNDPDSEEVTHFLRHVVSKLYKQEFIFTHF